MALHEQTLGLAGHTSMDNVILCMGVPMETIHHLVIFGWICGYRKPGTERMSAFVLHERLSVAFLVRCASDAAVCVSFFWVLGVGRRLGKGMICGTLEGLLA
jgi:hypothetical protein